MPESTQLRSYDDRPSSHLGVGEYLRHTVLYTLLPFIGFGAGYALRKITKLPALEKPYVLPFYTPKIVTESAKEMKAFFVPTADMWGIKIGSVWGLYGLWHDKRKAQFDTDDIKKRTLELKQFESADRYLTRENAQLRQQLEFLDHHGETPRNQVLATDRQPAEPLQNPDALQVKR